MCHAVKPVDEVDPKLQFPKAQVPWNRSSATRSVCRRPGRLRDSQKEHRALMVMATLRLITRRRLSLMV